MEQMPPIEYETTIFTLKPDSIGPNIATLLHARTSNNDGHFYKSILYLHGFLDYYFQDHVCARFLEHGYDFYALDLRKCGRSIILPEQDTYKHYCNSLMEYDEEITLAIEHIIKQAKNKPRKILMLGHSTGGLISCLYACSGTRHAEINALILNSPYLAATATNLIEAALLSVLIKTRTSVEIDGGWYTRSLHISSRGEWDFDTNKKPLRKCRFHGSFCGAVQKAHQDVLKRRITVKCPILFMCSNRSVKGGRKWRDDYTESDMILDVKAMRRAATLIGPQVTLYEVDNAIHDIFLSKKPVREKAFELMFRWLQHLEQDWEADAKF